MALDTIFSSLETTDEDNIQTTLFDGLQYLNDVGLITTQQQNVIENRLNGNNNKLPVLAELAVSKIGNYQTETFYDVNTQTYYYTSRVYGVEKDIISGPCVSKTGSLLWIILYYYTNTTIPVDSAVLTLSGQNVGVS